MMTNNKKRYKGKCFSEGGSLQLTNALGGTGIVDAAMDAKKSIASTIQATGLLNTNLNPNKDMSTLQGRIDAEGMGSNTGQNPLTRFIDDAFGNTKNQRIDEINKYGENYNYAYSQKDILDNYAKSKDLNKISYDPNSNIGGEIGDTLLAAGQGATYGASLGIGGGTALGATAGVLLNIGSKLFGKDRRRDINNAIDAANENQAYKLDNNLSQVNRVNAYKTNVNYASNGGQFNNGLTFIGNGGTHEQNPNGGVLQGVDAQGNPNLIEEGEVKDSTNYVFSNRNKPSNRILESVGLPNSFRDKTFADIAKSMSKESEERPADPISKRGLTNYLTKLQNAQEMFKQQQLVNKMKRNPAFMQAVMAQMQQAEQQQNNPQNQQEQSIEDNTQQNVFKEGGKLDKKAYDESNYDESNTPVLLEPQVQQFDTYTMPWGNKSAVGYDKNSAMGYNMPWGSKSYAGYDKTKTTSIADTVEYPTTKSDNIITSDNINNSSTKAFDKTNLRYAPVIAQAGMLGHLLSSKADYSNADAIIGMKSSKIAPDKLRDYIKYNPYDTNYVLNQLNQQQASSRAGLANNSGGNRANYIASMLGSDYNYGLNTGKVYRDALEYNDAQKRQVSEFNRGTNQYNSQMQLEADRSNQTAEANLAKIKSQGYILRQGIKDSRDEDIASAISGLSGSLGTIGENTFDVNMANMLAKYKVNDDGTITYKTTTNKKSQGGQLNTKKIKIRKGLTYEF